MLILTCSSKLQLLESVLRKGLPETLSVCGAVMHINRGNPAQHEVVVDSWPEFKTVLTRPRKEDGLYQAVKDMAEARHVHMEPYFYQAVLHPDAATFFQNHLLAKRRLCGTCGTPSTWPAMLILTCSSKLQLLESVLRKGLPETLLVCGAVMHINRGNPAQHEVVVDSWPEFKAVLTRPRKEVVKDKRDYYANLHAAFYREEDACRTLLENKDAVDWDKAFQLQGKAWALAISFPPLGDFGKFQKPVCSLKSTTW
ncbi:hypothetical protein E2320_020578 [Naja naja]|nr:hypothetical protein E2320_020578 [Naja naja]